jgi:hypothetical protein
MTEANRQMTKKAEEENESKTFVVVGYLYRLLHEMLCVDELTGSCHAGTWHVHGHGLKAIKALRHGCWEITILRVW